MKKIITIVLFALLFTKGYNQTCNETAERINEPGNLTAANPKLPKDFSITEKATALKTIAEMEKLFLKNFSLNGGIAKYWFHKPPFENLTGLQHYTTYSGQVGFYQYLCVNGKKITSDEYGVDVRIMANPVLNKNLHDGGADYYADNIKKNGAYISFCNYQHMAETEADKLIKSNSYFEDTKSNNYYRHNDVFRYWYISKPGTPVLVKVNRKEFLQSLLKFYEREKQFYSKEFERKRNDGIKYMEVYRKNGNTAMFNSSRDDKNKAETALQTIENNYQLKKQKAENLLATKTEAWLNEPAVIDPVTFKNKELYGDKTRNHAESFFLENFNTGSQEENIYKWNPEYFKNMQDGKPMFFEVRFRYKAGEPFSEGILNHFIKNFDFKTLQQLLIQ
ncbi:MAG: hypothetical protein QM725_02110 [Lacibacter sp.]